MIESAGLVVYRGAGDQLAVLLVHPSGNYNRARSMGNSQGLARPRTSLWTAAAVRETREETGSFGRRTGLENFTAGVRGIRRSRKRIHAFAAPVPAGVEPRAASWEVDRAEFLPLADARLRIHPDQLPLLDRLVEYLAMGGGRAD